MNKKDLAEIKKQICDKNNNITHIAGCYVDGSGEIKSKFAKNFANVAEDELFKYYEIFKKLFSGVEGKTALTMFYSEGQEDNKKSLAALRNTELGNSAILDAFYDNVVQNFLPGENYLILLGYDTYDIPVKTDDNIKNDESDEMYSFVMCALCPVKLEKAGLMYDSLNKEFKALDQRMLLDLPIAGFVYPAFNDRSSDADSVMYYIKKPDEDFKPFIHNVLGFEPTLNSKEQREVFQAIVEETLDGTGDEGFKMFRTIQEKISLMDERAQMSEEPAPLTMKKEDLTSVLKEAGVEEDKIKDFEKSYEDMVGEKELVARNLYDGKSYEVKSPDVTIKVKPTGSDLVSVQSVDGDNCVVVKIRDNIEVDGIVLDV